MRKLFQFFLQSAKTCEFFDKMQKPLGNFFSCKILLVFFRIYVQKLFQFCNIYASSEP